MSMSMSEKFTPGPWEWRKATMLSDGGIDYGIGAVVDGEVRCIAEAFNVAAENVSVNAKANAALIAAAPDLYAACKIAATAEIFGVDGIIDLDVLEIVIDAARAAIAKVEAGQ